MKRLLLITAAALLGVTPALYAQTDQEIIDRATAAAPGNAKAAAMVVKWNADGTRVVVRPGTNGLVCWDQSAWPGQRPFSAHCTAEGNLARVEQNREFFYKAGEAKAAEAMIQEAEKNGTRKPPVFGSGYYGLVGNDQASARTHVTIAVPFATEATLKLPAKSTPTGAWIMNAGTSAAHLMIPGH